MRILIGCEESGTVRDAFRARGFDAWSCDLQPTRRPGPHIQGDLLEVLDDGWALAIFHPDCTYLTSSGLHWNHRVPGRAEKTEQALAFVRKLMGCPIPLWALENPVGRIGTAIRPADQYIQPHQFGDDASKRTGLWLKGLPPLVPLPESDQAPPRIVNGKPRWSNQTDSGQNRLGPSETRARDRAVTYPGIAAAMAKQWGDFLLEQT